MAKKSTKPSNPAAQIDLETERRNHLRSLAVSKRLLRRSPATPSSALAPSKSVVKVDGRDIVKKGQRRSRFLFSFPGLLAPLSGGRIGELADLGTKNPVLYLEFPNGRMKLFGTHVFPKNKYLTLQLTKSVKGVMCEDCFESLIVFSEAWWIGSMEENPEESQLDFPEDISMNKPTEADFKGGAGATFEEPPSLKKPTKEFKEKSPSLDTKSEEDMDGDSYPSTELKSGLTATPVRHSARKSGKTVNYAVFSSGSDPTDSDTEVAKTEDEDDVRSNKDSGSESSIADDLKDSIRTTSSFLAPGSESDKKNKVEQSSSLKESRKSEESPPRKKGTLVQATLSTLFEKAGEKKSKTSTSLSSAPKGSVQKRKRVDSKKMTEKVQSQAKMSTKAETSSSRKKSVVRIKSVKKQSQVADDETENISSDSSQDDSDEDWAV